MAACAGKFLLVPGGISLALDGMVLLEPVPTQDVSAILLIRMARLAQVRHRLEEQLGAVRRVGIMATQAVAGSYRRMDRLLVELFLVVALKAEVRYGGGQGFCCLVLPVRRFVARGASLLHLGILRDDRMDRALAHQFLVTVETGMSRLGRSCRVDRGRCDAKGDAKNKK